MTSLIPRALTLPLPADTNLAVDLEELRLQALRRFGVLDTPAEDAFDEIAELAARLCGAPMALVSLVDRDRQWFKARVGFEPPQTPRSESFCAHALDSDDVLVVEDADRDPRFWDNPQVVGGAGIRFYAGAPLVTSDGHRLGTLCVLDTVPRAGDAQQVEDLALLSRQVVRLLELREQAGRLASEVVARMVAQEERARNQHLLDEVLGNTDVLIYAKDLTGRFVLANPALRDMIGPVEGELLGQSDYDLFTPEDAGTFRRNDALIATSGRPESFTEELNHADGGLRVYRSTKFPLRGEDGEVYAVAGVSTDVTELAAARSELKESQERWRALVEHSPVAVAVIAADGNFVYANPEALVLYGVHEREDIEGRPAGLFAPPGDLPDIRRVFDEVLAGGPPLRSHRRQLRQASGSVLTVEVNAVAVTYRGASAIQVELRDISTRAAAEEALRASEHRFRAVFDDSPVAMALADENGLLVDTNAAFGQLLAVPVSDLLGDS
ncbi:PAS domain S-box-containing protein [Nakamurella sp. UYEF19]|uniref:PAS domain S-box protein n=1 Tax=Nakamurella sp. UYEF19 TaxID=1756392 RepID=UPI0033980354